MKNIQYIYIETCVGNSKNMYNIPKICQQFKKCQYF